MIATIDFETTGLKAGEDEVLQVSIIDENYNVLLNVYCRPNNKDSWEDAQAVHGITPLMVANELPFERYVPTVLDILSKADKVIAYNAAFEDSYLKALRKRAPDTATFRKTKTNISEDMTRIILKVLQRRNRY